MGPEVKELLYFLHPTLVAPFNTAIVKGYNALTGSNVRLGKWEDYLAMREGILRFNQEFRPLLSNDLGAVAGLLFDIGTGRYTAPPRAGDSAARAAWESDLQRIREAAVSVREAEWSDCTHTQVQGWLRDLGRALGFAVWVAANDRNRACEGGRQGDGCLEELPASITGSPSLDAIRLIDVMWFDNGGAQVTAAFEVEHTTSIYSGIVRLLDLAMGGASAAVPALFLVAPDAREPNVRNQLLRPAFRQVSALKVKFLPYGELKDNRAAISRFGEGLKAIHAISRTLS